MGAPPPSPPGDPGPPDYPPWSPRTPAQPASPLAPQQPPSPPTPPVLPRRPITLDPNRSFVEVALVGGNPMEGQLRFRWLLSAGVLPWAASKSTKWAWTVACRIDAAVAAVACRQLGLPSSGAAVNAFPMAYDRAQ
ncbi:hypothetical protein TSOC_002142, partial [Tetrabaena socialis]